MIRAEQISKSYRQGFFSGKRFYAVKDISFHVKKGTTMGLLGDSGCGKSTVAKMLMQMEIPDSGKIFINGVEINQLRGRRQRCRNIQMIFQQPEESFDPEMRICKSLLEPMEINKIRTEKDRTEYVKELMDRLNLPESLLQKYPHQISGGEAQRLAIVRALTLNPDILILDEATSMLDVSTQAQILNLLKKLQRERELTYLFITHDRPAAFWMCDEILFMEGGKL